MRNLLIHSKQGLRGLICYGFLCFMALLIAFMCIPVSCAFAVTQEIEAQVSDAQRVVEETAAAYEASLARMDELAEQIEEVDERITELEPQIEKQQERGQAALSEIYKIQREGVSLIDMLLSAGSFSEFIESVNFVDRIYENNMKEVRALTALSHELDDAKATLVASVEEAAQQRSASEEALKQAQQAREEAQKKAEEQAKREAEEQARRAAEAQKQEEKQAAEQGQPENSNDSNTANGAETAESNSTNEITDTPTTDNADWSSDKASFVSSWAGRIDAYLSGSPLSGQGATFASAAWDYGIDPRFSPAISAVESSKGAACFMPHNAWGWGSSSWGSWEEAINAHVAGLARGYGYTVSEEAAKKYCPPNWQHWYSRVSAEMSCM